jgi:hypothetical protein
MTKFRQVHTKIWKDDWFMDLSATNKLFFLYLFTNERASISGIYELPLKVMSFESGLTNKEIEDAFNVFNVAGKARYQDGVVWVASLRKYHETKSPKVQTKILADVSAVKDCELRGIYCDLYGIDTLSDIEDTVSIPLYSIVLSSINSSSSKKGIVKGKQKFVEFDKMLEIWAKHFPGKPQPRKKNKTLRAKVRTRLKDKYFSDNWVQALSKASFSDFLATKGFFTFGWFVDNETNWEKVLDGNYDNKGSSRVERTEEPREGGIY